MIQFRKFKHLDKCKNNIYISIFTTLLAPKLFPERAEITMAYKELSGNQLDISASGRGLQQTLLLLAHLYANPHTALLLDEPDAHLEVFRQRQTYKLITDVAEQQGSQIIAASHSEIVLNEAADKDIVIAFVGKPHRIDDRGKQVRKALKEIGFNGALAIEREAGDERFGDIKKAAERLSAFGG